MAHIMDMMLLFNWLLMMEFLAEVIEQTFSKRNTRRLDHVRELMKAIEIWLLVSIEVHKKTLKTLVQDLVQKKKIRIWLVKKPQNKRNRVKMISKLTVL